MTEIPRHRELTLVVPVAAYEALANIAQGRGMEPIIFARNLFLTALQGVIEQIEAAQEQQEEGTPVIEERH